MGLFKLEVYRALAAGFLIGAAVVVASVGGGNGYNGVVPQAVAAVKP